MTGYEVLECPLYSPVIRTGRITPGELWSDDEINQLMIMRKQRLKYKTIATRLGRSEVSVRKKVAMLKKGKTK